MASNFHYTIDLNKDQNHQPFLYHLEPSHHHHDDHHHHHQVPSSSSSSPISQSSSYLPFLINSHQDQLHLGYNNTYHVLLDHQPLQSKMFVSSDGTLSCDQMVPKKETRLKLKIRKRDGNQDQTHLVDQYPTKLDTTTNSIKWLSSKMRLMKKKRKTIITNQEDHQVLINESVCNGNNINGLIRVCSDCNTTKTPLWRSGPRGPKSLCNACGIRQRKARRAAMAAAATTLGVPLQPLHKKKKKSKVSSSLMAPKTEICKQMISLEEEEVAAASSSSSNKNKLCFDDLTIMLSKNSTYDQQMFPQDEKEAAILLMSLSYGMVHG